MMKSTKPLLSLSKCNLIFLLCMNFKTSTFQYNLGNNLSIGNQCKQKSWAFFTRSFLSFRNRQGSGPSDTVRSSILWFQEKSVPITNPFLELFTLSILSAKCMFMDVSKKIESIVSTDVSKQMGTLTFNPILW